MSKAGVLLGTLVALWLSGCAGLGRVSSEVSSFGEWPAARQPGSYAFERLPSQQALATESDALEAAAVAALAKAGFKPAPAGQLPDVLVQVGSRTQLVDGRRWDERLWWSGGFGHWRYGPWLSPRFGLAWNSDWQRYDREVGVLIRDRSSGKPLYEARATNEGSSRNDPILQAALFEAALMDFPKLGMNPRRVVVQLPQQK